MALQPHGLPDVLERRPRLRGYQCNTDPPPHPIPLDPAPSITLPLKFHHALADGFTIMSTMLQGCSPRHPPARAASKRKRAKPSLLTKAGMLVSATLKLLAMQVSE